MDTQSLSWERTILRMLRTILRMLKTRFIAQQTKVAAHRMQLLEWFIREETEGKQERRARRDARAPDSDRND